MGDSAGRPGVRAGIAVAARGPCAPQRRLGQGAGDGAGRGASPSGPARAAAAVGPAEAHATRGASRASAPVTGSVSRAPVRSRTTSRRPGGTLGPLEGPGRLRGRPTCRTLPTGGRRLCVAVAAGQGCKGRYDRGEGNVLRLSSLFELFKNPRTLGNECHWERASIFTCEYDLAYLPCRSLSVQRQDFVTQVKLWDLLFF